MTGQLTEIVEAGAEPRSTLRRVAPPMATALALAIGVYLLYFVAYPARHLDLPMGFDPAYYVWRAQYLATQGIGTGAFAARPGYPLLSAIVGSVTGLSQLEVTPVLSLLLVALLALSVGAFVRGGMGAGRGAWVLVVAVTGAVVGPTHLVGENLSNTLNLALMVAALVPLAWAVGGRAGFWGAVALLVAAGVAHWDFLAPFAVVLVVAVGLGVLAARRDPAQWPMMRDEIRTLAVASGTVAGVMAVLIGVVLRAPLVTIEVGQDRVLYWKKFTRDLARLVVPAGAGVLGGWTFGRRGGGSRHRGVVFSGRVLAGWTGVMAAGVALGALTLKLPPARFLALLVALPGAIVTGLAVAWVGGRLRQRFGRSSAQAARAIAAGAVILLVAALSLPGLLRWYRYPVLLKDQTLEQAEVAGRYVANLPQGEPLVFVVEYYLPPFPTGPILAERSIKIGLPPSRVPDVHLFVGDVSDLVEGRQTPPPNARLASSTGSYRADVAPLLPVDPVTLVLQSVGGPSFQTARQLGGIDIGPGVVALNGPSAAGAAEREAPPRAITDLLPGAWWGLAVLVLLAACGAGWTRLMLDPHTDVETMVSLSPVVGAGVLIVGGLAAGEVGLRLGGAGGLAVYLVATAAGWIALALSPRGHRRTDAADD